MSWIAVGVGVSSLLGSAISSSAAGSAANEQAAAAANAQAISQNEFNTINAQEQPFLSAGTGATSQLNYLLGIGTPGSAGSFGSSPNPYSGSAGSPGTPATASSSPGGTYGSLLTPFTADYMKSYSPGYNFQLQQGTQGVLNQDAASSGALSGSALKDLISYNQNYANTAYNNAFNQYQTQQGNIFSRLSGIANLGQSAASQTAQSGTALAGQAAQSATNIGSALAGGTVGAANAWSSGLSNAALPWLINSGGGSPYTGDPSIGYGANGMAQDTAGQIANWPVAPVGP